MSVIVISGVGATTPVGGDSRSTWKALLAGCSGVLPLPKDWISDLPIRVAAPAAVDPYTVLGREARRMDRAQQFALVAAREAWTDAGSPTVDPERLAVVIASGIGGILTLFEQSNVLRESGSRKVSPFCVPMLMPNGPAVAVGIDLGAKAGVHAPVSACASGAEAIAFGLDLLRLGRADVVVCGGAEAAIHPLTMAGFAAMRALSRAESADSASRPFDVLRDGFVLGEGSAALVLESAQRVEARGGRAYAILAGAGLSADSYHMAAPDPRGDGAARAIAAALRDSDAMPTDVVHINAHATSTPLGDTAEANAIHAALGPCANVSVTATKSMTGHMLGAAGALEAVVTALSLHHSIVPPTINIDEVDPAVSLDLVRSTPRSLGPGIALSNSFGFGGHNVSLALRSMRSEAA